jgi:hypothetical protein
MGMCLCGPCKLFDVDGPNIRDKYIIGSKIGSKHQYYRNFTLSSKFLTSDRYGVMYFITYPYVHVRINYSWCIRSSATRNVESNWRGPRGQSYSEENRKIKWYSKGYFSVAENRGNDDGFTFVFAFLMCRLFRNSQRNRADAETPT